jgi:hypothetical protein
MFGIKLIFCFVFLINSIRSFSFLPNPLEKFNLMINNSRNDSMPVFCEDKCADCFLKLKSNEQEIESSCSVTVDSGSMKDICWSYYIIYRCYREYANKYCIQCDQYNAYEKYTNDLIEYIEQSECNNYTANPC